MIRNILCPKCSQDFNLHPEDAADGWSMRKVTIRAKVPTDGSHRIQVMAGGEIVSDTPVPIIVCDYCNDEIPEGTTGVANTMWRRDREPEPERWEDAYSKPAE